MKYLKKIMAVALAAGMVFSGSVVDGRASSYRVNNYFDEAANTTIDELFFYDEDAYGKKLGVTYEKTSTEFVVWAPVATDVKVNIYTTGSNEDENALKVGTYVLEKLLRNGTWTGAWEITLVGRWDDYYYDYTITNAKDIRYVDVNGNVSGSTFNKYQTADPYGVAASEDGQRSYVIDPSTVSPDGWSNDRHVYVDTAKANTVYKVSVKNFSTDPASGTTGGGKYSAFTETGATVNSAGELVSGIDYLKELGVTTVQLAPFADFASTDEYGEYDIQNFNVPESSYASKKSDSKTVIKECKEMIQALHKAGISVVMEMPYTHTVSPKDSVLEKTVPGYFYRMVWRDSANGYTYYTTTDYDNECATERAMYRNYIVDSMAYWAKEYHVDGFSIDLISNVNTRRDRNSTRENDWLSEIKTGLAKKDSNLVIWGDDYQKADRQNKTSLYDTIINNIGGSDYGERNEKAVKIYKQTAAMKYATPGTLYMDAGEEMCNSVNGTSLKDSNLVEWQDSAEFADVVSYYRGLMDIRKAFSPLARSQDIASKEAYVLTNTTKAAGEWNSMAVLNNETDAAKQITIPNADADSEWVIIANGESTGVVSRGEISGATVNVPAYTTMILVDKASFTGSAVSTTRGKVVVQYLLKDSKQPLREAITLQGTPGTGYKVPANIKIPSGYTLLSKEGSEKGKYTAGTQTVTYYYSTIDANTVVDGIKNNGTYCENAKFKVTSAAYTEVTVDGKKLTAGEDGYYTVSAADGVQKIALSDKDGYSIYLTITVNKNHTTDSSDCTKESTCSVCHKTFPAQASHKFGDTWLKDDTYHWKVCENEGCKATSTKTKHSGTDDGDCTTAVTCKDCGQIITEAKAEHTYGEWQSNGDGTHTRKCTAQGCTKEETKNCTGGEATCTKKAVCTECQKEYGDLNPKKHSGSVEWVQTETTHQEKYNCCGAEVSAAENHIWENGHCSTCGYGCNHTGGTATCTEKAICIICKLPYGEVDADHHTGMENWAQTATTHEKKYDCCGKVTVAKENHKWKDGVCETCGYVCVHSGGEATCTSGAICENCGKEYTAKDLSKHSGKVVWVQTESDHRQVYDCCDAQVSASEAHDWEDGACKVCDYQCKHTGGSATCVKKAECVICGEQYGVYNMSVHEGLKFVEAKAATKTTEGNVEYWYCEDCGKYYIEQNGFVEVTKEQTVVAKLTDKKQDSNSDDKKNPTPATGDTDNNKPTGSNGNDTKTTPTTDTKAANKAETTKKKSPKTADDNRMLVWFILFAVGGTAAGVTVYGQKRRTGR